MCGRYNISDSKHVEAIAEKIGLVIDPFPALFNIAPTENVPVIYQQNDAPAFNHMRWWLVPSWSSGPSSKYAMFNARVETLATSGAYKKPFGQQRAIIPASSFIEWTNGPDGKQPMEIQPESGPIAFAGLWDYWTDGDDSIYSCSIITTAATKNFSHIHKRMPVMLAEGEYDAWLDHGTFESELSRIMAPRLTTPLFCCPISKAVNRSSDKSPPIVVGKTVLVA